MVAGANLGSALNPLLEAGGDAADPARLRLPLGNLLNRLAGCLLVLILLPWAAAGLAALDLAPARLVANSHLAFNLATAALAFPLLPPLARLLTWLRPERPAAEAPGTPRYLDPAALATPPVALANAAREVLRMADTVEAMLHTSAAAFASEDRDGAKAIARLDDVVDRLHQAVHDHLARLPQLPEAEARRLEEVRGFAIALEHVGDVLERDLARHAHKRLRRSIPLESEDRERLAALHAALVEQLRLAIAVFMWQDLTAARRLVREKEAMREAEQAAMRRLAETADRDASQGGATAGLMLDTVRDLRRVGGHLASVAHPLLQRRGELLESRLAGESPAEAA
jgi:phosphate:Na+ symporter